MKFKFKGYVFELAEALETSAPVETVAKVECALLQFDHPNWAGDPQEALVHHLQKVLGDVEILELDPDDLPEDAII
mgnify:FL=1